MADEQQPLNTGARRTFDEELVEKAKWCAAITLGEVPELRSIAIIFDYHGRLNSADVPHTVWIGRGPDGRVGKPEEVIGMTYQLMKLLDHAWQLASAISQNYEATLVDLGKGIVQLKKAEQEAKKESQEEAQPG